MQVNQNENIFPIIWIKWKLFIEKHLFVYLFTIYLFCVSAYIICGVPVCWSNDFFSLLILLSANTDKLYTRLKESGFISF